MHHGSCKGGSDTVGVDGRMTSYVAASPDRSVAKEISEMLGDVKEVII